MADILYLEDELRRVAALTYVLEEKLKHQLVRVEGVGDCLEFLKQKKFDLVILDIMIRQEPEDMRFEDTPWQRNGLEILKKIRNGDFEAQGGVSKDVPIIVISAVVNLPDKNEILSFDVLPDLYLEKPIRTDVLEIAVSKALGTGE